MAVLGSSVPTPERIHRGRFLALATLSQTGGSWAQQGVAVLSVFLAREYHLSLAAMGGFVTAASVGGMLSRLFLGILVDRRGPRWLLSWGATATGLVAVGIGFSRALWLVYGLLFLLGFFLASIPAAGTKAVLTAWQGRARGLPMGIRQTGVPIGAMLAAFFLPRLAPGMSSPQRLFWAFAVALWATSWLFAAYIPPRLGLAAEGQSGETAAKASLGRAMRVAWLPAMAGFFLAWGQYDVLTYSIPYLHLVQGQTVAVAGAVLAAAQVGGALGRIGFGALSDRWGGRRAATILVVLSLGVVVSTVVATLPKGSPLDLLFALWFFMGSAMAGWNALLITWAGELVPSQWSGTSMSLIGSSVMLGSAVAPPIFGWVAEAGQFGLGWGMLASIFFGVAVLIGIGGVRWANRAKSIPA